MDPPPRLTPGTVRWRVLAAIANTDHQLQWSVPQIAGRTELTQERVEIAIRWLRERQLCELKVWLQPHSLFQITDHGREALAAGAQLALDVK